MGQILWWLNSNSIPRRSFWLKGSINVIFKNNIEYIFIGHIIYFGFIHFSLIMFINIFIFEVFIIWNMTWLNKLVYFCHSLWSCFNSDSHSSPSSAGKTEKHCCWNPACRYLLLRHPATLALQVVLLHKESEALHMQRSSTVSARLTDLPEIHPC